MNGSYFDSLVSDDLVDDLLSWMSDPKGVRSRWEPGRWGTLYGRCVADYGFDPGRDGEMTAAERLGTQPKAAWKNVWNRYAVAPSRYPDLEPLLRKSKPAVKGPSRFAKSEPFWPQENDAQEGKLRQKLVELPSLSLVRRVPRDGTIVCSCSDRHPDRRCQRLQLVLYQYFAQPRTPPS